MSKKMIILYINDGKNLGMPPASVGSTLKDTEMQMRAADRADLPREINELLDAGGKDYIFVTAEGDIYPGGYMEALKNKLDQNPAACFAFGQREYILNGQHIVNKLYTKPGMGTLTAMPDKLNGVMIKPDRVKSFRMNEKLKWDAEGDFLLRLIFDIPAAVEAPADTAMVPADTAAVPEDTATVPADTATTSADTSTVPTDKTASSADTLSSQRAAAVDMTYASGCPDDSHYQCYSGIFDRAWYFDNISEFLIPLLEDCKSKYGEKLPLSLQYYVMYMTECRLMANQNNRNKHVLTGDEIYSYRSHVTGLLSYIDNEVIMNVHDCAFYSKNYQFNRMLLRLKYYTDFLNVRYMKERTGLAIEFHDILLHISNKMLYNVQLIDYRDGAWEIDASVPDIYPPEKVNYYFVMNGKRYDVEYNGGYSLTKYFGEAAYKRYTFHARIALEDRAYQELCFVMEYEGKEYTIHPEFQSHTGRLTAFPVNSYWHFGDYLAYYSDGKIIIEKYKWKKMARRELGVWKELLAKKNTHTLKFLMLRMAYCITRPYYKRKNIWMFYDKIYKGGDSSEYLYKYAKKKKDGIKKYYLLDKNVPDYARLKKEGYRPLKRNSFKHRLVFLNADMMIVSNSTVFAFNGYYLENSRYVRGFTDFHVVCVQHGLSVQKIALAQQRLRDNTRLYFCASKYEIENLSKPVYNYRTSALKLTGVPRYDGLIDVSGEEGRVKTILISPTWRMQSAMLVSKNEGVERDYNPDFKNTEYYKVYNSLINDSRLIEGAKEHGYRIAYVLHPIVSPQAEDFDKNDYVDIIPSTGDMSYEKLFCESALMVTDFSGVQFDFAYMRKPLVYLHHDDLEAHYEEGTYRYDTMAFGEICHNNDELIELLTDYMKNGCKMKEKYVERADDFFAYNDRNNCERIYDEMRKYQAAL